MSFSYWSLKVVPSLKARTPAKTTNKTDIPARSGDEELKPDEKSTVERSKGILSAKKYDDMLILYKL